MNGNDLIRWTFFFRGLWTETLYSLICSSSYHSFRYSFFICEESSTYGAQFKRMCIAVILCINDALWLIFSSFSIFLQISWKMAVSRKKLSSSKERRIGGRSATVPHHTLIDNFLSYDDSCLPCGNNICLIRMFL